MGSISDLVIFISDERAGIDDAEGLNAIIFEEYLCQVFLNWAKIKIGFGQDEACWREVYAETLWTEHVVPNLWTQHKHLVSTGFFSRRFSMTQCILFLIWRQTCLKTCLAQKNAWTASAILNFFYHRHFRKADMISIGPRGWKSSSENCAKKS